MKIIISTLLVLSVAGKAGAQLTIPDRKHANVGLVYPVSTNWLQARSVVNCFSFNLLAGLSAGETGLSVAGLSNIVFDSSRGVQIAGLSNHILHNASGVQLAGFMNSAGSSRGLEIAGFANINQENAGNQVAGFINIAKKVKGVQIAGFINIADSSDYPIALFNFIKDGEMSVGVSTDESLTNLVTFRSGGRRLYGIAGLGYNHRGQRSLAAWELGFGGHLVSTERFRLNVEGVTVGLTDFQHGSWVKESIRVLPAVRLNHRVEIFAGPTFNYLNADNGQGQDIIRHYLWSDHSSHQYQGLFFGATAGITISLTHK
jgi:hypothetical protein